MKKFLFICIACCITPSCSHSNIKIETNNLSSDKQAVKIATEALDNILDVDYNIINIDISKDTINPKSYMKFEYGNMSDMYRDYFTKEKFRKSSKKEARITISKARNTLKEMPSKHIGYRMVITGSVNDGEVYNEFNLVLSTDIDMTEYIYEYSNDDWTYYRAYNHISKDSLHYYLNSREIESAISNKYTESKNDVAILFK